MGIVGGATFLALGGFVSRIFGLYRLLLPRLIGPEGVGLYHMAYPVYATVLAISSGGLPVAISKLVADAAARGSHREARQVLVISVLLLGMLGSVGTLGLYLMAPSLAANVARDQRAALAIASVAPAVLLVSAMSALRGYYQGYQLMWPTALSQVVEQIVRVAAIIALVVALSGNGVAAQAAGAASGASFGAFGGLVALLVARRYIRLPRSGARSRPRRELLRELVLLAIPITVAGLGVPVMQMLDLALVPARLQALGFAASVRTGLYGELSGYAMPLVALPAIVSGAVAVALVPAVAGAMGGGDRRGAVQAIRTALRATLLWTLPAAAGLYLMAPEMTDALFASSAAGSVVRALAPSAVLFGIAQVAAAALQGAGETWLPLRNLGIAAIAKLILTWEFLGQFGITGAGYATVAAYLVWAVLNAAALYRLGRVFRLREQLLQPALATCIMIAVLLMLPPGTSKMHVLLEITVGLFSYFVGLVVLGGLRASELEEVPLVGPRIAQALLRLGLGRR